MPRKCKPITMIAMPATIASSRDHACDERADRTCARAEGDEHGREAGDEQQRREHRLALDLPLGLGIGEALERSAGEIDEIGRHQRQHAGRQEAQQPGEERGSKGDVGTHGRFDAPSDEPAQPGRARARGIVNGM